ncbi:MAG: thiamine pyrophosphate-binding protein [Chloroflexi bacterium]|nr:thiamine pyrophosphate-binding protein [Chloroflexota bacterium]MCI0780590.1 thiamine pyrophosphate-binding protein [Chloroflexota bacterium]MCI0787897.1 thiamine pyrophosphate-binding protein [Chloroflexota bacterium]MCI0798905.1 thiamine pyrophosphate-binding protein [Chloroflexota bacterium]MCI0858554.1 thiamine pyrophosphate-binding protein [Chloroflexota bacterium]
MSLARPEYVSDLIVYLLNGLGIDYVPLNPGATTRGIHESMVTYGGNQAPELITCCHEELAVAMAEGYYLATGKPLATLVHNIVGLQHASKAIYEAWLNSVPMIIIGGTGPLDASHRRPWIDWIHTAQVQSQIIRDYVKWDDQPQGAASVAESVIRAYQIAMTEPRGPVYLCFDVELQESRLPDNFPIPDLSRFQPPAPPAGNPAAISQGARALLEAERPVLIVEGLGRSPGGSEALQTLAELLGIPVIEQGNAYNLPNHHPLNVTGANAEVLKDADLVVTAGVKDIEATLTRAVVAPGTAPSGLPRAASGYGRAFESLIPEGAKLMQIGLHDYGVRAWSSSYGKLLPADVHLLGNEVLVLKDLADQCQGSIDAGGRKRASDRAAWAKDVHNSIQQRTKTDVKERWWDQTPTSTARLASEIWEAIKEEDWVLVHGSLSGWEKRLWKVEDESRWVAGGGGTGTGMGVAMGAALAFRGTNKVCVSIQNDGDLLYTAGSLWTASHHDIPMLIVMFNNRSYYQDVGHQTAITQMRERSLETVGVGVDLVGPDTDFATLAKSFNVYGVGPIHDAAEISAALKKGLDVVKNQRKPALVDTVVQPR